MRITLESRPAGPTPVMYVANSGNLGGANRVLTDLVGRLDRNRFVPNLVAPADGQLVHWAEDAGVPCHIVPDTDSAGRAGLVRRAARLVALMVRTRTRLVHVIDPRCYRAAGVAAGMIGAVRVCHVELPVSAPEMTWAFRSGPDMIVTCYRAQAAEMSAELERLGLRRPVVAIPNAVDTSAFAPAAQRGDGPTEKWREGAKHVVLIVGHLSEIKGHPTFLHAAKRIAASLDGCAFLALGGETISRGYQQYLEQLTADLGIADRVRFLGWKKEVGEILCAADVVVLPSLVEGLPLSVLEAMACARPVVASAVNGTPEAVQNEVTGLLVQPNDAEGLSAAILRLLNKPELAMRMGIAGRRRVEKHFSLDGFVASVQLLYDDLLPRRSRTIVAKAS